jgi:hypothetical protein
VNRILAAAAVLVTCSVAASGCGGAAPRTRTSSAAAVNLHGQQIGRVSTPGTPRGEQTVSIEVLARTGPERAAIALVPVRIDGRGPFPFALDTGASTSLISAALATRLHLVPQGPPRTIEGVTGGGRAYRVRIGDWSAGKVALPPTLADELVASGAQPPVVRRRGGAGPVGLLGSDVLSRYGKIAVDYDRGLLVLDPPVR